MALTVDPQVLVQTNEARISILNSSHVSETVQVVVSNGDGQEQLVDITLDAQGNGSADWTIPSWAEAQFNYGSCEEIYRTITSAEQIPVP